MQREAFFSFDPSCHSPLIMRARTIATSFLVASSGTGSTVPTATSDVTKHTQAFETVKFEHAAVSLGQPRSLSAAGGSSKVSSRAVVCPEVSYSSSPRCDPGERAPPLCNWALEKVLMYDPAMDTYEIRNAEELVAIGCELPSTSCQRLYDDLAALKARGDCGISKVEEKFANFMQPLHSGKSAGRDKKTIIAATVGGVFVILFVSVGAYMWITDPFRLRQYYA